MTSTTSPRSTPAYVFLSIVLAILALAGCGGGDKTTTNSNSSLDNTSSDLVGDKASDPSSETATLAEPVLSLTPRPIKTFHFSWNTVTGATAYNLLEDPDGASGYAVVAALGAGFESYDLEVFLPGRINARYILQACDDDDCIDSAPVNVSGTLADAVGYFKASNTGTGDGFGVSVALSADGNTLAVGASNEDSNATGIYGGQADNSALESGAVYVFSRTANGMPWKQQAYVKASDHQPHETNEFGVSVSLSADGNTLAVGAYTEDSSATGINGNQADNSAENSGAVYVFTRLETVWSQQAYIKASNTENGDLFGLTVALSSDGNTLAVGAPDEDSAATGINGNQADNRAFQSGAVYVFRRTGVIWAQESYIKASNTGIGDFFGRAISLSGDGNTLAVGSQGENSGATGINGNQADNSVPASGAVYVFTRNGADWSQQAYVKASNTDAGDLFGWSVALSANGNTLAVGAWGESSSATGINGDQADNSAHSSGAVYVFIRKETTWSQQAYVKASNTSTGTGDSSGAGDAFGESVALASDGNTLAVGCFLEGSSATGINGNQADNSDEESGAVYVFIRSDTNWSQQAYVKASNTDAGDAFGANGSGPGSIALSGDGNTLAAGATGEDSNATGIDGNQADNSAPNSGAVYLY